MESQPQSPEFRINPENFHPWYNHYLYNFRYIGIWGTFVSSEIFHTICQYIEDILLFRDDYQIYSIECVEKPRSFTSAQHE